MFSWSFLKRVCWIILAFAISFAALHKKEIAAQEKGGIVLEGLVISDESLAFLRSFYQILGATENTFYYELTSEQKERIFDGIREAINKELSAQDCNTIVFSKKETARFRAEMDGTIAGIGVLSQIHPDDARPHERRLEKFVARMHAKYGAIDAKNCTFAQRLSPVEKEEYEGIITALTTIGSHGLLLAEPRLGSPAEKAGLKKGWLVKTVDGKLLEGMRLEDGTALIKGAPETRAVLGVAPPEDELDRQSRAGKGNLTEITVTRAPVQSVSVWSALITAKKKDGRREKIGYVRITQFSKGSDEQFGAHLKRLAVKKLVIDVRNNGGGYTEEVLKILDHFVPPNHVLVTAKKKDGSVFEKLSAVTGPFDHRTFAGTIVVLINGGSASASEILAGVLRDYKLATIIGEKTEGKGSIQEVMMLPDGTLFKITVAHYALPSGILIDGKGIEPDVKVVDDPNTPGDEAISAAVDVLLGWKSSP